MTYPQTYRAIGDVDAMIIVVNVVIVGALGVVGSRELT